jgi:hypothetical protein
MAFQCWERDVESGEISGINGAFLGSASDGDDSSEVGGSERGAGGEGR